MTCNVCMYSTLSNAHIITHNTHTVNTSQPPSFKLGPSCAWDLRRRTGMTPDTNTIPV